jgi:hypothetical protein
VLSIVVREGQECMHMSLRDSKKTCCWPDLPTNTRSCDGILWRSLGRHPFAFASRSLLTISVQWDCNAALFSTGNIEQVTIVYINDVFGYMSDYLG